MLILVSISEGFSEFRVLILVSRSEADPSMHTYFHRILDRFSHESMGTPQLAVAELMATSLLVSPL